MARNRIISNKKRLNEFVILSLLIAVIVLLGLTPLGMIPLGFIYVTILCVPVIIGTLYLGWKQGMILGLAFGLVSFYTALTKPSGLGAPLMAASPILTFVMCVAPRLCVPLSAWMFYHRLQKKSNDKAVFDSIVIFGALSAAIIGLIVVVILYFAGTLRVPQGADAAVFNLTKNNLLLLMGCIVLFAALVGGGSAAFTASRGFQRIVVRHAPAAVAAVFGSLTNTVLYLGLMLLFYVFCGIDTAGVLALIGGTALIAGLSEAVVAAILVPPIFLAVSKLRR